MSLGGQGSVLGAVFPTLRDPCAQNHFERDGIVVVPMLDPLEAADLRRQVEQMLPADPGEFFDLFRNNPPELRKRIDRMVRDALEDRARGMFVDHDFWSATVLVKPPGQDGGVDLHTDWNMVDESRFRSGLLWLALDDTSAENGGIFAAPGTNRLDLPYRGRDLPLDFAAALVKRLIDDRTVAVDVPVGQAAIWDNRLLHGSGANTGREWRIAAALGFKPRSAQLYHYRAMPDGLARRYAIEREFFLDYEPFTPGDTMAVPHVLGEEVLPQVTWELTPEPVVALGPGRPIYRVTRPPTTGLPEPGLSWLDISATDAERHPTLLADIAARRVDGITLSGVFTEDEAAQAVARLERFRDDMYPAIFGRMLGVSLADLGHLTADLHDRTPYLDRAERSAAQYREAFGFDPAERVHAALTPMGGGRVVTSPREDGRRYPTGNVRWMLPGGGGLPAHVGNEFQLQENGATDHLRRTTHIRDHYSWFVILQAPDEGGALSVFDRLYETHAPADGEWGPSGRRDAEFDQAPAKLVAPAPGTLVLFGGGWRWHRVNKIEGSRARVTYGGFAGPSIDGSELHLWF